MISAACCGLISGMTKLVVALSADEINFFSFESSKTVTRVIVLSYLFQNLSEKSFNLLAADDSSYTVPFSVSNCTILVVRLPEPLRFFRAFQIIVSIDLYILR